MNQGLSVASGDILVIMNPDVRIKQGIEGMMEFLFLNNNIGIIAPKIVNANGVLQDSFRYFITPWNFLKRHVERLLMKSECLWIYKTGGSRSRLGDWGFYDDHSFCL